MSFSQPNWQFISSQSVQSAGFSPYGENTIKNGIWQLHLRMFLDTLRSYTGHLETYASTVEEIWTVLCGPQKKIVRDTPLVWFRISILDKNYLLRGVKTGLK